MFMEGEVRKFMKKYHLKHKDITPEVLQEVSKAMGYEVIYFNPCHQRHRDFLEAIGMAEYAAVVPSFLCRKNDHKIIFVSSDTSRDDQCYLLLHEMAHLYLDHFYHSGISNTEKERQANHFTDLVLHHQKRRKALAVIALCGCLITTGIVAGFLYKSDERMPTSVYSGQKGLVVVTPNGTRYHMPDCHYIQQKEGVFYLPVSEAVERGYSPCRICCLD